MLKSHGQSARFKAARPFPLHRLPSLLKRSLSVSAEAAGAAASSDPLAVPSATRPLSVTAQRHVLLELLPSVRSSAFVWTYTRLLCTSASYIAGMSFYDFFAALLSLSHRQMRIYDVLGDARPTHSRRKLVLAWTSTALLVAAVIVVVQLVVRMSERRFAYQIHRELHRMERIEARIRGQRSAAQRQRPRTAASALPPIAAIPEDGSAQTSASRESADSAEGSEEDDADEEVEDTEALDLLAALPPPASSSPHSQPRAADGRYTAAPPLHPELVQRIKVEEDKRAVCRALISSDQTEEEIEDEGDVEEALGEALEAGLSAQEIARQASSQRRLVTDHDAVSRISSSSLFLYRLCDLCCYYCIFVAVYAFQNTLQLSVHTDVLHWSALYCASLLATSLLMVHVLESKQEAIDRLRLEQEERCQTLHDRLASRRLKQLQIKQASWKKLSVFVASSFAYLLAYAVWAVMQASIGFVVPGELLKHPVWLWFNAAVLIGCSGAFIVLLNVRVYSALDERPKEQRTTSLAPLGCCSSLIDRFVRRPRTSTARLHIRVDIVSGQVTSIHSQMTTEALSYILALSIGAALTASLPAVPSDAATYTYDTKPSGRALLLYALSCSVVLALSTLWLERWVRRIERRHKERAREVLRGKLEGRERIEIREVTGSAQSPAEAERFSANTHENALYILKRQFQHERTLRGEDDDADRAERQQRVRQSKASKARNGNGAPSLPSPSKSLAARAAAASSPLLSPQSGSVPFSPQYGAVSSPSVPSSPVFSPLMSPLASPVASLSSHSPSASSSSLAPASSRAVHRSLLTSTLLQEYQIAIASTLTQGFALLVRPFALPPRPHRSSVLSASGASPACPWSLLHPLSPPSLCLCA